MLSILRAAYIADKTRNAEAFKGIDVLYQGLGEPEACDKSECAKANEKFCKQKRLNCDQDRRIDFIFDVKDLTNLSITNEEAKKLIGKAFKSGLATN